MWFPLFNVKSFLFQVLAVVPGGTGGGSPAVQGLADVSGELPGESPAVQVLAGVPGGADGESPAVQVLANINRDSRRVFETVKTLQVSTVSNTPLTDKKPNVHHL